MRKISKLEHAAKVVALCLPPVVMSLIGLTALSRKQHRAAPGAGGQSRRTKPVTPPTDAG